MFNKLDREKYLEVGDDLYSHAIIDETEMHEIHDDYKYVKEKNSKIEKVKNLWYNLDFGGFIKTKSFKLLNCSDLQRFFYKKVHTMNFIL